MKKIITLWRLAAKDKSWLTLSNGLTTVRLIAAPCIVVCLYTQLWRTACILFFCAASTDLLDGHLARTFNQQTYLGTMLDPMADKSLLLSVFGSLAFFKSPFFHVPSWFFVMVLCREVIIVLGTIILLQFYKNVHIEPTFAGKMTTLLQILFLLWVFICYFAGWEPHKTQLILLVMVALFSGASLMQYIRRAIVDIREK